MIENEFASLWQSSANQQHIKVERSQVMLDVQTGIDRLNSAIRYRDWRETFGVAVIIPSFAFIAYKIPYLMSRIGSIFIILWAIYALIRLRNARKNAAQHVTENYLDYLHKVRQHFQAQKHLMDTVLYWYILPCQAGTTLLLVGIFRGTGSLAICMAVEAFNILIGITIYLANKRAIKKTITPRIDKIDALIEAMQQ